ISHSLPAAVPKVGLPICRCHHQCFNATVLPSFPIATANASRCLLTNMAGLVRRVRRLAIPASRLYNMTSRLIARNSSVTKSPWYHLRLPHGARGGGVLGARLAIAVPLAQSRLHDLAGRGVRQFRDHDDIL